MRPPSGVNFNALLSRFRSTCFTLRSSARIVPRRSSIVWFRATLVAGKVALIPFVLLLAAAAWLWRRALVLDERGVDRQAV